MNQDVLHVGRKSTVAYVLSGLATVVWLTFWTALLVVALWSDAWGWAAVVAMVEGLVLARGIYALIYLRTIRWILTEEGVRVMRGVLPWRKTDFFHPYDTIFESFYTFGFFAKVFGYGTVSIRRAEGVTTHIAEPFMDEPVKIVRNINGKLRRIREAKQQPVVVAGTARSEVEELAALAKLRADGDITTEEYDRLKLKVIGAKPGADIQLVSSAGAG